MTIDDLRRINDINSPIQDYVHPDDYTQPTYKTPGNITLAFYHEDFFAV